MVGEPTIAGVLLIIGMLIFKLVPVVVLSIGGWMLLSKRGREFFTRFQPRSDTGERLLILESEVGELRRELSEMHERLDFAERMLANPSLGLPQAGSGEDTPTPPEVAAAR